jgi:hypothetical protein
MTLPLIFNALSNAVQSLPLLLPSHVCVHVQWFTEASSSRGPALCTFMKRNPLVSLMRLCSVSIMGFHPLILLPFATEASSTHDLHHRAGSCNFGARACSSTALERARGSD